jgi:hypothetical protein
LKTGSQSVILEWDLREERRKNRDIKFYKYLT